LTLQQLRYFLAAAAHGSFSAAATSLGVAQPSVSEQVRRLEAELGVALFRRAGRGLVTTDAGTTLRPYAEAALRNAEAGAEAVAGIRDLTAGTASFGAFGTALHYLLGDLVQDFRERYPAVRLRIVGENSVEVAEKVRDGRLEAGLVVLPIDDGGLEVRPVMREQVLFVSTRPERLRAPMTIERLARLSLILPAARYGALDPTRRQLAERAQRAGVRLEPAIEVEELAGALELVARGLGDCVAAEGSLEGRHVPRGLGSVPFAEPIDNVFAFIHRSDSPLSPATVALMELAEYRLRRFEARRRRREREAGAATA
jgi:DNA-binding transcriptional LysR family regulator